MSLNASVIYKHGEPLWNDTDRGKFLIHPPDLSDNPTSIHLLAIRRNLAKEIMNLAFDVSLFIL
jgi:hypothetical protein